MLAAPVQPTSMAWNLACKDVTAPPLVAKVLHHLLA